MLAAGIGTTIALYAVVRALLPGLPGVPAPERVGRIYASNAALGVERGRIALNELDAVQTSAAAFDAIGGYADEDAIVGSGPHARPAIAGYASPAFFRAMAVPPAAGRVFSAADPAGAPVVVLSDALWRREFPDGTIAAKLARLMAPDPPRSIESFRSDVPPDMLRVIRRMMAKIPDARFQEPIEVAVLGCAVNGIGEASHADFGITGAKNEGLIFAHGKPLRKVPQDALVDELFAEIDKSLDRGGVHVEAAKAAEGAEWLRRIEEENAGELTPERIAAMEKAAAEEEGRDVTVDPFLKPVKVAQPVQNIQ